MEPVPAAAGGGRPARRAVARRLDGWGGREVVRTRPAGEPTDPGRQGGRLTSASRSRRWGARVGAGERGPREGTRQPRSGGDIPCQRALGLPPSPESVGPSGPALLPRAPPSSLGPRPPPSGPFRPFLLKFPCFRCARPRPLIPLTLNPRGPEPTGSKLRSGLAALLTCCAFSGAFFCSVSHLSLRCDVVKGICQVLCFFVETFFEPSSASVIIANPV